MSRSPGSFAVAITSLLTDHGPRLGKLPLAAENLGTRAIQPHRVVRALHDRDAVRDLPVTSAELHGGRAVGALLSASMLPVIDPSPAGGISSTTGPSFVS